MPARSSTCLVAALLGIVLATPSRAETFIVNGALVENVEGLDRTILDYGENYPPPSPTHAVGPGHRHARRAGSVLYYDPSCLLSDGQVAAVVSCRSVPHLVGDPLE
jgi:hypothetical protein